MSIPCPTAVHSSPPISRAPPEIVMLILALVIAMPRLEERWQWASSLASVCRLWAAIVESIPLPIIVKNTRISSMETLITVLKSKPPAETFIWSMPYQGKRLHIPLYARLSTDGDIDSAFQHSFDPRDLQLPKQTPVHDDLLQLTATLARHLSKAQDRFSNLALDGDLRALCGWETILAGDMHSLRCLRVWVNPPHIEIQAAPAVKLHFRAPLLKTLVLQKAVPPPAFFPNLTYIVLHDIQSTEWARDDFIRFLSAIPAVEVLDLEGDYFFLDDSDLKSTCITLPNLRRLTFTWFPIHPPRGHPLNLLLMLDAPSMQALTWTVHPYPLFNVHPIVPPLFYLRDVRSVVCQRPQDFMSATVYFPDWLFLPKWYSAGPCSSVETLLFVNARFCNQFDQILSYFPRLRRIHYVPPNFYLTGGGAAVLLRSYKTALIPSYRWVMQP